jgi:type II secretory pathway pseudopilin PulG
MHSTTPKTQPNRRRTQRGFTLLMLMFTVAIMLIGSLAVTENILTEGRREKEAEMVWRGEQYARAIGLYYRKFGKYPTQIDDLVKQTNGIRFLRQAYKDPMNKEDGSWRFIYFANGQLVGSLRPVNPLTIGGATPGIAGASPLTGGVQPFGQPGAAQPGQQTSGAAGSNLLDSQSQPLTGSVLGGFICGVGSKVDKPSFRVYMSGTTYKEWEFLWLPVATGNIPGQVPTPQIPGVGAPGTVSPNTTPPPGGAPQPPTTPTM